MFDTNSEIMQVQEELIVFQANKYQKEDISKAFPWYSQRTLRISDPIIRMHNETIDFHLFIMPSKQEHAKKCLAYQRLKKIINDKFSDMKVFSPFLTNQLYLKGTQIQLYILSPIVTIGLLQTIKEHLQQSTDARVNQIKQAQQNYELLQMQLQYQQNIFIVRILQEANWKDFMTLIEESISQIVELKYLYSILSCMLRQRAMHLTLRSYLLFALLSVFYYERNEKRKHKHRTLTQNILKFTQYYGVGIFQQRKISYLGKNKYELLQEGPPPTPFSFWINQKTNISNPIVKDFFNLMKNRYRLISNYNYEPQQSIIGSLVNPCQRQFYYL